MKFLLFLLFGGVLGAQTVSAPNASILISDAKRLVAVRGAFANLLPPKTFKLDRNTGEQVISVAFAGLSGAVKTSRHLLITDVSGSVQSSFDAPAGPALIGFENGRVRAAYYASLDRIDDLNTGRTFAVSEPVLALGPVSGNAVQLVTMNGSQLWLQSLSLSDNSISSQIPLPGGAPVCAFEGGWLTSNDARLLWTPPSGESREIALEEPAASLATSSEHAVAVNGKWLVTSSWQTLRIPAAPQALRTPRRTWR
jgi:hypothetical protein